MPAQLFPVVFGEDFGDAVQVGNIRIEIQRIDAGRVKCSPEFITHRQHLENPREN